jgi:acetyl-CoA carboxylase carboxyltransferase component
VIIATEDASLGMGGPAMIAGGGLGEVTPDEVGPMSMQEPNGTVDLVVADEAAAVAAAKLLLSYFHGPRTDGPFAAADQAALRDALPESGRRAYDVVPVIHALADEGSVTVLRPRFAREMVTAFARIEGRPVGIIANNTKYYAGAIMADSADKAARFLQLCDCYGIPIVSLVDTPGFMVGPRHEETALVRHTSRLLIAGASLTVPFLAVVLRRGYGLGAQAMVGGSLHEPILTIAWPSAHLGPMGLEGAVRLAMRRELEAIPDEAEREARVRELTGAAQANAAALNAAQFFELDDVVDPADTRAILAATLVAAGTPEPSHRTVDAW